MAIDLVNFDIKAREAVKLFWRGRAAARKKQLTSGKQDQGERAGVMTTGRAGGLINALKGLKY